MKKSFASVLLLLGLIQVTGSAHAEDARFPHRAKYRHVPIMEAEDLRARLDDIVLVDVRSRYEYETLHIKGALHIALHKTKLPAAAQELRRESAKPIVFYCNGTTCKKSYEAAEYAIAAGVTNVYAYDAGLDLWTRTYPEASVLLGRSPISASDLIDKDRYKARLLSASDFEARVEQGNAIVLDIRDLRQRDVALFPFREERAQLDDREKIAEVVARAKKGDKPLLVYDKVGKQAPWFQYYLEREGVKHYYFMDGGAEGYHEAKFGKLNLPKTDS